MLLRYCDDRFEVQPHVIYFVVEHFELDAEAVGSVGIPQDFAL